MALRPPVTAALAAAGAFCPAMYLQGAFNVSIYGAFNATVTLQRSFDGGATWLDCDTWSAPVQDVGDEPEGAMYRLGVKTGDYVSGTVNVRLGQ